MSLIKYKKSNEDIFSNAFDNRVSSFFDDLKDKYTTSINAFKEKVKSSSDLILNKINEYVINNKIDNKVIGKNIKVSFSSKINKYYVFSYINFSFKKDFTTINDLRLYIENSLSKYMSLNNIRCYVDKNEIYFVFKSEI